MKKEEKEVLLFFYLWFLFVPFFQILNPEHRLGTISSIGPHHLEYHLPKLKVAASQPKEVDESRPVG